MSQMHNRLAELSGVKDFKRLDLCVIPSAIHRAAALPRLKPRVSGKLLKSPQCAGHYEPVVASVDSYSGLLVGRGWSELAQSVAAPWIPSRCWERGGP